MEQVHQEGVRGTQLQWPTVRELTWEVEDPSSYLFSLLGAGLVFEALPFYPSNHLTQSGTMSKEDITDCV